MAPLTRPPANPRPDQLWDVENATAHVNAIIDSGLGDLGARLTRAQRERLFVFLHAKCWELAGLERDGRSYRHVFLVVGFLKPAGQLGSCQPLPDSPEFGSIASAERFRAALEREQPVMFSKVVRCRPRSAYMPGLRLSFSTYSRRILTLRIADWYRSDTEFGDTRYGNGERSESIEDLAERAGRDRDHDGDSFLDRHGPGSRLEFLDELNRHAYQDSLEEVLTHEAIGL